jgi:hypothetical protein
VHDAGEQCDTGERRERCRTMWTSGASGLVRPDGRTPGLIITVVALSCVDSNIAVSEERRIRANRRRIPLPVAIPPVPSLSGGLVGAGDGGGPEFRRSAVDRLVSPRFCSPSLLDGGARVCRRGLRPWRLAVPSGVGEVVTATAQRNKLSRPLHRPGDAVFRRQRRGRGFQVRVFCFTSVADGAAQSSLLRGLPF